MTWAWTWELIARLYGYNPGFVPAWIAKTYGRVEQSCVYLSSQALDFYQYLGYCIP